MTKGNKRSFRPSPDDQPRYPAFDARRRRLLFLIGAGAVSVMARGGCMPMYPAPADADTPPDAGHPDGTPDRTPPRGDSAAGPLPDG